MYLIDNPVLQRELLVNLRTNRAFILLFLYLAALGGLVFAAWPAEQIVDMSGPSGGKADKLVDLFFLGQYILASLMAPSFAAGTISGEKERKTYESLLATRLRPSAIILGKLLAALSHVGILIFCSLPIVMLCVPLGGVSLYEVLAAYLALIVSVVSFGMISIACSSFFRRTVAALSVSYLIILPLALIGAALWGGLAGQGALRLFLSLTFLPAAAAVVFGILFFWTANRLMYPPDVGSEGKEVVDLDSEMKQAVGMVIQSDQWPDKMFAPAKRNDLIPDGTNPVYDKEMRSELFSQGTLMLRVVIQVSMFLAIPLMAFFFYIWPHLAPWYISYVIVFNMLIGPVFSADRVTSERERETLDLMLTTNISPWQILWGKLFAGLRVSTVLTMFLIWPVLLAAMMVSYYWANLPTMFAYLLVVTFACGTTSVVALFCSVIFRKTSISLMSAYMVILVLFAIPPAANYFVDDFIVAPRLRAASALGGPFLDGPARKAETASVAALADSSEPPVESQDAITPVTVTDLASGNDTSPAETDASTRRTAATSASVQGALTLQKWVKWLSFTSPFTAVHDLPLEMETRRTTFKGGVPSRRGDWSAFGGHLLFSILFNSSLLLAITWLFNVRWRVTS